MFFCKISMHDVADQAETIRICIHGQYQPLPHSRPGHTDTPTRMQKTVNHWAGILQASGGALVPEKCFWYAIDFKWHKDEWH